MTAEEWLEIFDGRISRFGETLTGTTSGGATWNVSVSCTGKKMTLLGSARDVDMAAGAIVFEEGT